MNVSPSIFNPLKVPVLIPVKLSQTHISCSDLPLKGKKATEFHLHFHYYSGTLLFSLMASVENHQQMNKTYFHANETTCASFAAGVLST